MSWLFARNDDLLVAEHVDQFRILHRQDGLEAFAIRELALHVGFGNRHFFHIAALDLLKKSAK